MSDFSGMRTVVIDEILYVSLLDLYRIRLNVRNPRTVLYDLKKQAPNFINEYLTHKFSGRGQRDTPIVRATEVEHHLAYVPRISACRVEHPTLFSEKKHPKTELRLSDHIATLLNGEREVRCGNLGRIDVLTPKYIIEVKKAAHWIKAVGQLVVYSEYYPNRQKLLWLFGEGSSNDEEIKRLCAKLGIIIIWDITSREQCSTINDQKTFIARIQKT